MNHKKIIVGFLLCISLCTAQLGRAAELEKAAIAAEEVAGNLAKELNIGERATTAINTAMKDMAGTMGMEEKAFMEALGSNSELRAAFKDTLKSTGALKLEGGKFEFQTPPQFKESFATHITSAKIEPTALPPQFTESLKLEMPKVEVQVPEIATNVKVGFEPEAHKVPTKENVAQIENQAKQLETEANKLQTGTATNQAEIENLLKRIAQNQEDQAAVKEVSITNKQEAYIAKGKQVDKLKSERASLQKDIKEGKSVGLEGEETFTAEEITAKEKRIEQLNKEITDQEFNLKRLEDELPDNLLPFKAAAKRKLTGIAAALNPVSLLHTVIMGLVFGLSGMIQSSLEQLMQGHAAWETMSVPQKFGGIWMQIPRSLISDAGKPLSYFPLYVALSRPATDTSGKRDDNADTDSYAQTAPLFVSRDDYDNWAKSAIPSGDFPGRMVELRTGAHVIGSGALVPGNEMIQLIGEVTGQRGGSTVALKLNDIAGGAVGGVTKQEYEEYLIKQSGYSGSSVIANLCTTAQNETELKKTFPDLQEDRRYPALLNASVQTLMNGTQFGTYNVKGFQAIGKDDAQKLDVKAAESKPYVPMGILLYQTADTPFVQSVRAVIAKNPTLAPAIDALYDYVLMLDDSKQPVRLQLPLPESPYNFPTWTLNPNVKYMLSLFDGTLYTKDGHASPSGIAIDEALKNYPGDVVSQITTMRNFMVNQVKNGPFIVGNKTLTIDPKLAQKGVYVYEVAQGLENGGTDYLVATSQLQVMQLPGAPDYFVSLVSSRIYDSHLILHNEKNGGYTDYEYTVYQQAGENKPPLVVLGAPNPDYGKVVVQGLRAPLGTIFVGYDLNPNNIARTDVRDVDQDTLQWLAKEVGAWQNNSIAWPLPIPSPLQWALSERGPQVKAKDDSSPVERIGAVITKKAPELLTKINNGYKAWKTYANQRGGAASIARQLETYVWVTGALHAIVLQATGADDIKNGNYVYMSGTFPSEYLVMSGDKKGTSGLAQQFDPENPQPYVISLSTGSVYGRAENGEQVGSVDVDALKLQPALNSALAKRVDESKTAGAALSKRTRVTTFGPYTLYLFDEDAKRKQYIYADVTGIKKPEAMDQKQLFNQITDLFVAIEPKKGTAADAAQDPANWVYGKQISANTINILNITNGDLFNRGGTSLGFFKDYTQAAGKGMDVQGGYLDHVLTYLATTWGQEKTETTLRAAMKDKILALTKQRYDALIAQSEEVKRASKAEQALRRSLDSNVLANLSAAPFVQSIYDQAPRRFVKSSGGKYYLLGFRDSFNDQPTQLASITDFNVGDAGKDTKRGAIYDARGASVTPNISGVTLDALRASIGLVVGADGSQTLDIPVFQPNMITDPAVHIKLDAAALSKEVSAAVSSFITAKSGDEIAKSRATLTKYQPLLVAAQTAGKQHTIYYNAILQTYLLLQNSKQGRRYIDLINGTEYDEAGYPYIEKLSVYQNGAQLLIVFPNTGDSYTALYSPDGAKLYRCSETKVAKGTIGGQEAERTHFFNVDLGELITYNNKKTNEYTVYKQAPGAAANAEPTALGTFKKTELYYTALQYVQSGAEGASVFNDADAKTRGQLEVLLKGTGPLNIQQLINKDALVTLDGSGKGSSADGSVQATAKTKQYTNAIKGSYVHYTQGVKQFDYVPVYSFLDPVVPVDTCKATNEFTHLVYWKQCKWQMNVVYDANGILRIAPTLPTRLTAVDAQTTQRLLSNAPKNRAAMVSTNIARVLYDRAGDRYVYQVTQDDTQKDFARGIAAGSYVDLYSGIVYAPSALGAAGSYPQRGLLRSSLLLLLNELEFSVSPVQDDGGSPLFDSYGMPLIDGKTKQQLRGRYGLVYRGQSYVEAELKRITDQMSFGQQSTTTPTPATQETGVQPVKTKTPVRQGPAKIDTNPATPIKVPQLPQGAPAAATAAHNTVRSTTTHKIAMRKQPAKLAAYKKRSRA